MRADGEAHFAAPDPGAGGFSRVIVIDAAAGRVPAVHGVAGSAVGALGHRLVELSVIKAGKRSGLIDDLRNGRRYNYLKTIL